MKEENTLELKKPWCKIARACLSAKQRRLKEVTYKAPTLVHVKAKYQSINEIFWNVEENRKYYL